MNGSTRFKSVQQVRPGRERPSVLSHRVFAWLDVPYIEGDADFRNEGVAGDFEVSGVPCEKPLKKANILANVKANVVVQRNKLLTRTLQRIKLLTVTTNLYY
jgi:hypothetical protein